MVTLENYFRDHQQRVVLNGQTCPCQKMLPGVSPGLVYSPLSPHKFLSSLTMIILKVISSVLILI